MAFHTTDDGCRLAYTIAGPASAPTVVLSNSLGTDRGMWAAQAVLAETFRVVTYDTRGHGESAAPPGDYPMTRLGQDVVSLLDGLGIRRAHVCGVSIGGLTALWLGVHARDRIDRLVLANTAARIGSRELWAARIETALAKGLDGLADAAMERWFTEPFRAAQPETIAAMRRTFRRTPVRGYVGCCAALRDADLRVTTSLVKAPSLVITGRQDPATPPEQGRWLAHTIAGARLEEFDAAHLPNIECAAAFTDAVDRFLRDD
jgi:3-oxoadipate enol-lactonase